MEKKTDLNYYVPSVEELYPGFRYEWLDVSNDVWLPKVYNESTFLALALDRVRVKYLDKQDLEDLGWEQLHKVGWGYEYKKDHFRLNVIFGMNRTLVKIYTYENMSSDSREYIFFRGNVKNKSELEKLIQMLNI